MNQSTDPPSTPISSNPFIVGNPIRDREMFFGREAEFELVRKRFIDSDAKGGLLVFCGERRSGKTSILFQILDGRLGSEFLPVLIDMQSMAIESELDFLSKIADEITRGLKREGKPLPEGDMISGSNPAAAFHKYVGKVLAANSDRKLILLFDEYELFENKIDSGVLTEDTLFILSNLMENHSVFLIFTGSLRLDERRRDYWKIFLGKSIYRQISYLEFNDAKRLIEEPVKGRVSYEEGLVDAIYRLTAGQPFYTQAICQNVVDNLNEHRSSVATKDILDHVVTGIVQNPFPQMIFLWEGWDDREKLVMALLSETLEDEKGFAQPRDLMDKIREDRYPLNLDNAAIATSLEKMFKDEILLKNEETPAGYAMRMDLWRRWVRRMHSVWQVMREIGMAIRPVRRLSVPVIVGAVVAIAILGVAGFFAIQRGPPATDGTALTSTQLRAFLELDVRPTEAIIYLDGRRAAMGYFAEETTAGDRSVELRANGYADSTFTVSLAPEDTERVAIDLRALVGQVVITTQPPGAEITVDGTAHGTSPVTLTLEVAPNHFAEADLAGHQTVYQEFRALADSSVTLDPMVLTAKTAGVQVNTIPTAATVTVDGRPRGSAPVFAGGLALGTHQFRVHLAGYVRVDTTLTVGEEAGELFVTLRTEPPGHVLIHGDDAATMILDGRVIMRDTFFSEWQEVSVGAHDIEVRVLNGQTLRKSLEVKSGERVDYNYTTGTVQSNP